MRVSSSFDIYLPTHCTVLYTFSTILYGLHVCRLGLAYLTPPRRDKRGGNGAERGGGRQAGRVRGGKRTRAVEANFFKAEIKNGRYFKGAALSL